MNKATTSYYGDKGGLFNNDITRCPTNENTLLNALLIDNKKIPLHLRASLEPSAVLTPDNIQKAIAGLPSNKKPGTDGFPSEYFKTFCLLNKKNEEGDPIINPFAITVTNCFKECLQSGEMLPCMREGIVSILYKNGDPSNLDNYRPITVLSSLYKILARSMVAPFADVIPYLVSQSQARGLPRREIHW